VRLVFPLDPNRFPKVQTSIQDPSSAPSTTNFLEREKAILGDDANQFASVEDGDIDDEADFLGGGGDNMTSFHSQFPDITSNEVHPDSMSVLIRSPNVPDQSAAPTGMITSTGPSVSFNSGFGAYAEEEEEPEVIKQWREKRDAQIAKRAEQFSRQREETVKDAQQNIDDFYENYNNKKEKTITQTHKEADEFLANREDTTSGGTSWERIAKLVDVSGKGPKGGASGSGKERFRELLVSLRKDEKAPGAEGY
jgi:hypothetical protein